MKKLLILSLLFTLNAYFVFPQAKVCVLPFVSNDEDIEKEYSLTDGIARLLVNKLNYTKRINAVDYDIMVAYLYESYIGTDYKTLSTNTSLAIDMLSNVFSPDYIIAGSVETFSSSVNKGKEKVKVSFQIDIIDVKLKEKIDSIDVSSIAETEAKKIIIKTHDAYFSETAFGIAVGEALLQAANEAVVNMDYPPLKALITRIEGNSIYINAGKANNVFEGDILNLYKSEITLGESSNDILESESAEKTEESEKKVIRYKSDMLRRYLNAKDELTYIGKCQIKTVYQNYSIAEIYKENDNTDLFIPELLMLALEENKDTQKHNDKNIKIPN